VKKNKNMENEFDDIELEFLVIRGVLFDLSFRDKALSMLKPYHFANEYYRWFFKQFIKLSDRRITKRTLFMLIKNEDKETCLQLKRILINLYEEYDVDESLVALDLVKGLIKVRKATSVIFQAKEFLEEGKIDDIFLLFDDASKESIELTGDKEIIDYFDTWEARKKLRRKRKDDKGLLGELKLELYDDDVDIDYIFQGGLVKKKFCVLVAPWKRGKTTFLVHVGSKAIEQGFNVLWVAHEGDEQEVIDKFDARFLNLQLALIRFCEFADKQEEIDADQFFKKFREEKKNRLKICYLPQGRCNANDIRNIIIRLRNSGFNTDILIDDYAELINPIYNKKDKRLNSTQVYWDFKNLAKEQNILIWSVDQAPVEYYDAENLSGKAFSESKAKAQIIDLALGLAQTKHEKKVRKARVQILDSRFCESGDEVEIILDTRKAIIMPYKDEVKNVK